MNKGDFQLGVTLPLEKAIHEEDGDLIIEGLAADYSPDRAGEAFVPGVFAKAIDRYLASGGPLMFHHKKDQQLGQVVRLEEDPSRGLLLKAIIPKPQGASPLADVYNKVKRGMMRGLSVYGTCTRERAADGRTRIVEVDLQEISVTPQQYGPNALFEVAQKAFPGEFGCTDCGGTVTPAERAELDNWFNRRLGEVLSKAVLSTKKRNDLPASAFVFPKERRYPIHDRAHAANALARSSGKPEERKVRAAVCRRYPDLPACKS